MGLPSLSNPSPLALPASAPGNQLVPDGVVVVGPIVTWHPLGVLVRPARCRQACSAGGARAAAEACDTAALGLGLLRLDLLRRLVLLRLGLLRLGLGLHGL